MVLDWYFGCTVRSQGDYSDAVFTHTPEPLRENLTGLSRLVQRRAPVIVVLVVGALVLLAAPFTQAKTQDTDYRYLPRSSEIRAFFERVHRH